jgi:hypothetical protein
VRSTSRARRRERKKDEEKEKEEDEKKEEGKEKGRGRGRQRQRKQPAVTTRRGTNPILPSWKPARNVLLSKGQHATVVAAARAIESSEKKPS